MDQSATLVLSGLRRNETWYLIVEGAIRPEMALAINFYSIVGFVVVRGPARACAESRSKSTRVGNGDSLEMSPASSGQGGPGVDPGSACARLDDGHAESSP